MRKAEFRKTSWHCQIAQIGGLCEDDTDICTYLSHITKGLIGIAFMLAVCGTAAWVCGESLGWLLAMVVHWTLIEPHGMAIAATIIVGGVLLIGSIYGVVQLAQAGARRAAEDTFIGDAVDSLRNRMCFRVRIR